MVVFPWRPRRQFSANSAVSFAVAEVPVNQKLLVLVPFAAVLGELGGKGFCSSIFKP
jgi:hypothetical protein